MRLFSKINENIKNDYLVESNLRILISAENEGEAGYISDSILGGIEELDDYEIINISPVSPISESNKNWMEAGGYLQKSFELDSFKGAIDFINRVGEISERENHHPKIEIDHNKVVLKIRTEDLNEITQKDRELSLKIDNLGN